MPRPVGARKLPCSNCGEPFFFESWRPSPLCPFCIGMATLVRRVKKKNTPRRNRLNVAQLFVAPTRLGRDGKMIFNSTNTFAV